MWLNQKFRRKICVSTILGLKCSKRFLSAILPSFSSFLFKVKEANKKEENMRKDKKSKKQQKMKGGNMNKKQEQQKKQTRSEGIKRQICFEERW